MTSSYSDIEIPAEWFVRPNGDDASGGIHGLGHTRRVLIHGLELADTLGLCEQEREAVRLAALWHDIGRTNDRVDYYHGAKSAGKAVGLGLHEHAPPEIHEIALFAVTHHSGAEEHAEIGARWMPDSAATLRVFRALKDADGLDRVRLGDLDPSYLRFAESKTRIARAWELLREIP